MRLTRCDDEGKWTAAAFSGQVDLGGEPTTGATQGHMVTMLSGPAALATGEGVGACGVLRGEAGSRVHADHAPSELCRVYRR